MKGATVRKKDAPRRAPPQPGVASRRPAQPYPIQIVSTRWIDPRTGRFVRTPVQGVPLRLKVAAPKTTQGMVVTRISKRDEATGLSVPVRYKVQYLEARAAHRRGELGARELRDLEQDLADGLLSEEGQAILAKVEQLRYSQEMGAAYRSDKAKRAAVTRKANAATRKHRPEAQIRADLVKAEGKLSDVRRQLVAARTAKQKEKLTTSQRNWSRKIEALRKEARAAGVKLQG